MLLARILIVGSLVLATRATQETVQPVKLVQQLHNKLKQLNNLVPMRHVNQHVLIKTKAVHDWQLTESAINTRAICLRTVSSAAVLKTVEYTLGNIFHQLKCTLQGL